MSMRNSRSLSSTARIVVLAMTAVLVLTMAEPPMAAASPATPASKGLSATSASSDATDFSSARRRRRTYRQVDPGLAIMGMMIGTIGVIAAQQRRREYYDYHYGYGPGYYGGGPYYYGARPYYGPRYHRHYRHW